MVQTTVHILPEEGIGGAELAAASFAADPPPDIPFKVFWAGRNSGAEIGDTWRRARAIRRMARETEVALAIFSLWRTLALMPVFIAARPRARRVLMLHSAADSHRVDRMVTRGAARLVHEVWTDSPGNVARRLPGWRGTVRRISYFFPMPAGTRPGPQPAPDFVYWGRLNAEKNLPRALAFFAAIHARHAEARFTIIGPDQGVRALLTAEIRARGLEGAVTIHDRLPREEVARIAAGHSFFLLSSLYEGACMSAIEAMQLGLVPVVTPVGDIPSYCREGESGVFLTGDDRAAVEAVDALLADPARYAAVQAAARATWKDQPTYRDSMAAAIRAALAAR